MNQAKEILMKGFNVTTKEDENIIDIALRQAQQNKAKEIIKIIKEYQNPYPKDIFKWSNEEKLKFNRGRFNEFIYSVVENTRKDLIKLIEGD